MDDLYNNSSSIDNDNTSCFLKDNEMKLIRLVSLVFGSFSLLSCLLMLTLIAIIKKFRTTTQRVILYLTLTVTLNSIVYILHGIQGYGALETSHAYCTATGFLDELMAWMKVMAILCLNIDFKIQVTTQKYNTKKYEIIYFLSIFIFPLTFNWIPFIHSEYGSAGAYCWIRLYEHPNENCSDIDPLGEAFQFALFWGPFMLIVLISSIIYVCAVYKARSRRAAYPAIYSRTKKVNNDFLHSEIRQYMLYPVILIGLNLIAFISRIVDAADPTRVYFSLHLLHILCISIEGLPMAVVFVLDKDTRHDFFNKRRFKAALYSFFCAYKLPRVTEYTQMDINAASDSVNNDIDVQKPH